MAWMDEIQKALVARDEREKINFEGVFASCNTLSDNVQALHKKCLSLHSELNATKAHNDDLLKELESLRQLGSPETQQRFHEVETELKNLKLEQAEVYRTQSQNAQKLLEALEANREQERRLKRQDDEMNRLNSLASNLHVKVQDSAELIKEKDGVIQILKDELATHQLELVQREEQLKQTEEKLRKLEAEHNDLVERWLQQKQQEAQKVNEANEIMESALKSKQEQIRRVSSKEIYLPEPKQEKRCFAPTAAIKKINIHDQDVNCIQISRDGSLLATGSNDKRLLLIDAKTGTTKAALTGSLQAVMSTGFNANGEIVLGSSNDNSVKIWTVSTSRPRASLTGHIGKVYSAKFTDSNRVVSGSHDRTLKIWDLAKGYCVQTIFTLSSCNDLDLLDGEGSLIVSGHLDNNLRFWDTRSGNLVREVTGIHTSQITGVNVSPGRNSVLTTSRDNTLKIIDLRTYEAQATFAHESFRVGMNWTKSCFSPDGGLIASGSIDGSLVIWNAWTGQTERILKENRSAICGVVWNPSGSSQVYAAEKDRSVVYFGESS